tara:strand:- start:9052 stop:12900 length:3849 start_codon:yes stop_codon:yes gene_type:complete
MISKYQTKQDLISAFRIKNPRFGYMSDDAFYNMIVRENPRYKIDEEDAETEELVKEPIVSRDTNIFDSLPDVIKDGYNRSIAGQVHALANNKEPVFDLSNYDPNIVEDLGAGLISFIDPLTIGAMIGSGGAVNPIVTGVAKKYVLRKLIKNGASVGVAKTAARKAMARASAISRGAAPMAAYSGANSALKQKLSEGSIDPSKVVLDSAKGAVLGGVTSATGSYLTEKGANTLARVGAEIGIFGGLSPVLEEEPRAPTPQDFVHAGSMVLGIKGVNKVFQKGKDTLTPRLKEYVEGKRKGDYAFEHFPDNETGLKKAMALRNADARANIRNVDTIWYDRKGTRIQVTGRDGDKVYGRNLDKVGNDNVVYNKKFFDQRFKQESFAVNPETARVKMEKDVRSLEKKLGVNKNSDQSMSRLTKSGIVDPKVIIDLEKKKLLPSVTASNKVSLKEFNTKHLADYRDELLRDLDFKLSMKDLEKRGVLTSRDTISLFFDTLFPESVKKLFQPFRPVKNQGTSAFERRVHNGLVYQSLKLRRELEAEVVTAMKDTGLSLKPSPERINVLAKELKVSPNLVRKDYYKYLSDAIEKGSTIADVVNFRTIMNRVFDKARKSGIVPSGRLENYLPRMYKDGLSNKMMEDLYKIASHAHKSEAKGTKGYGSVNDLFNEMTNAISNPDKFLKKNPETAKILNEIIEKSQGLVSKDTKRAFNHLIENERQQLNYEKGKAIPFSYYKAMTLIGRDVYRTQRRTAGNIEYKRKKLLPDDYYERDAQKLLARYASNISRATAEASIFGKNNEVVNNILKSPRLSQLDKDIIRELQAHVSGEINYHKNYSIVNPKYRRWADNVLFWNTATKIGGGTASALNLTQVLASSGMEAGYTRMISGAYKYLTDKRFRRLVDGSGADLFRPAHEMMGFAKSGSKMQSLADFLTDKSQFNRINSINNIVSASIGKVFIEDMLNVVRKGGTWKTLGVSKLRKLEVRNAKNTLDRLGIKVTDIKKNGKISDAKMMQAMGDFAVKTQVQKNILTDPLWLNRPSLRLLTQFKTFPVRNANYMRKQIESDLYNYNIFPLLRLGATGVAGAGIALKAKEYMKYVFSGEKSYEPENFINTDGKDIVEALTAIGAFGYMSDVMSPLLEEGADFTFANKAKWLAQPAFWSDFENLLKTIDSLEKDFSEYKGEAIYRVPSRALKLTGSPLLKQASKRVETKGLKQNRIKYLRGRKLAEFRSRLIDGDDRKKVVSDIRDWNNYVRSLPSGYGKYRITISDYNRQALIKAVIRKNKKKV